MFNHSAADTLCVFLQANNEADFADMRETAWQELTKLLSV